MSFHRRFKDPDTAALDSTLGQMGLDAALVRAINSPSPRISVSGLAPGSSVRRAAGLKTRGTTAVGGEDAVLQNRFGILRQQARAAERMAGIREQMMLDSALARVAGNVGTLAGAAGSVVAGNIDPKRMAGTRLAAVGSKLDSPTALDDLSSARQLALEAERLRLQRIVGG